MPEFHAKRLQRDHPDPNAIPLKLGAQVTPLGMVTKDVFKVMMVALGFWPGTSLG